MPNYVNFLHTQLQQLVTKIQDTYFDCYIFCCCNKRWLSCLMHEGNSFKLLLNNISKLFIHLEARFPFMCPHRKAHFRTNTPCQLMIINVQVCMIIPRFECTHLACHIDLFHLKSPDDTLLKGFFSFLLVRKKLLLFKGFYQPLYLLRKEYLQSILCLQAILQVF